MAHAAYNRARLLGRDSAYDWPDPSATASRAGGTSTSDAPAVYAARRAGSAGHRTLAALGSGRGVEGTPRRGGGWTRTLGTRHTSRTSRVSDRQDVRHLGSEPLIDSNTDPDGVAHAGMDWPAGESCDLWTVRHGQNILAGRPRPACG